MSKPAAMQGKHNRGKCAFQDLLFEICPQMLNAWLQPHLAAQNRASHCDRTLPALLGLPVKLNKRDRRASIKSFGKTSTRAARLFSTLQWKRI
jgi:hypothetical protein